MNIPHPGAGSYPLRAGNAVRPLIDGEPAFSADRRTDRAGAAQRLADCGFLRAGLSHVGHVALGGQRFGLGDPVARAVGWGAGLAPGMTGESGAGDAEGAAPERDGDRRQ